ncbi:MAG: hypothetical protein KID00_02035 [Clostridium argentinense]|uniref:Lipoprotein n=1 Tax=Clostridium faecium TaxID=2762223 RepID=A0ABR8YW86_9CLOT|nr:MULTISPECIES: hypothetical protein [Clostridium]MBD8048547.1 hypothetical protein [Clostridium faecium]MBS5822637.1 hypothetical protein [Clostridium argentinense]MDU1347798.1 hypothetical protein [Clostridium argentinense]
MKKRIIILLSTIVMFLSGCGTRLEDNAVILEENLSEASQEDSQLEITKELLDGEFYEETYQPTSSAALDVLERSGDSVKLKFFGEELDALNMEGKEGPYNLQTQSDDKKNIYFNAASDKEGIYKVKTDNMKEVESVIILPKKEDFICNFNVLKDGNIIFRGIYNESIGVFYYNASKNSINKLIAGGRNEKGMWIPIYSLSPHENKIIYYQLKDSTGNVNIYGGTFSEGKIKNVATIEENIVPLIFDYIKDGKGIVKGKNLIGVFFTSWDYYDEKTAIISIPSKLTSGYNYERRTYVVTLENEHDKIDKAAREFIDAFYTVGEREYNLMKNLGNNSKNKEEVAKLLEDSLASCMTSDARFTLINDMKYINRLSEYTSKKETLSVYNIILEKTEKNAGYVTYTYKITFWKKSSDNEDEVKEISKSICLSQENNQWKVNNYTKFAY